MSVIRVWRHTRCLLASYGIAAAVWLCIGSISILQQRANNPSLHLDSARLIGGVTFWIAVLVLTLPVFSLGRRYPVTRKSRIPTAFLYIGGYLLFTLLLAFLRSAMLAPWSGESSLLHQVWIFAYANASNLLWIYVEILLAANAFEYYERARSETLERAQLEQALAASELQLLKAQLHPHFIFNTLHGIATLAREDGARASEMVLQLAKLLRAVLEHSKSDLIPLQDELRFVSAYLDLEKMRLGSRLVVRCAIDRLVNTALVPHLLLQPLVENAIVHGVAASRGDGFVEITARAADGEVVISIVNSSGSAKRPGTGMGLRNTHARLERLYGADAKLTFASSESEGVSTTTVCMPLIQAVTPVKREVYAGGR